MLGVLLLVDVVTEVLGLVADTLARVSLRSLLNLLELLLGKVDDWLSDSVLRE